MNKLIILTTISLLSLNINSAWEQPLRCSEAINIAGSHTFAGHTDSDWKRLTKTFSQLYLNKYNKSIDDSLNYGELNNIRFNQRDLWKSSFDVGGSAREWVINETIDCLKDIGYYKAINRKDVEKSYQKYKHINAKKVLDDLFK